MKKTGLLLLVAMVFITTQAQARSDQSPEPRIYQTRRIDGVSPKLDGLLDDAVWGQVSWSSNFVQREPNDGASPTAQTRFKLLYDDQALYFAFHLQDDPELVQNRLARRDGFPGDWIEVNIDSYHDYRTAFSFTLSASGTRGDEFVSNDGNDWDGSWDPIWEGATEIDGEGWTAEMMIPLSQLRFGNDENQVWGLQVQRRIARQQERSTWQRIPRDISGWVSNFGEIHGIQGIKPSRRIEIMPYALSSAERFESVEGNPFRDGSDSGSKVGMDGKIGLTSNLTVDFTINPDFGQVEADPSEVNLTAFESYFSEKRPFFVEGADIFNLRLAPAITGGNFTSDKLFYSRRIGKRPAYRPDLDDGQYVDMPDNTSIAGAFKLSGKTDDGLSIGILEGVTSLENAEIAGPGGRESTSVEPTTNYFVGRVMQDYRNGDTVLGAMLTGVNRRINDPHLEFLRRSAYAGGLDLQHYFNDRNYRLEARIFGSHLRGTAEAIDRVQTSSARYFQRPDNDHVVYDPTRTSINGSAGSLLLLNRRGNSRLRFQTGVAWRTPGFEINDIGYMRVADEINQSSWVGFAQRNPVGVFNNFSVNFNQWLNWDWGGNFLKRSFNMNSNVNFKNRWGAYISVSRHGQELSNARLRGGPASKWPGYNIASLQMNSDSTKPVWVNAGTWTKRGDENSIRSWNHWGTLCMRPSNALQIRISPDISRTIDEMQYMGAYESNGDQRYVLGRLDQKTFSLTFRVDYCLRPGLSIQYYGSPFISAGRYSQIKRSTDPVAESYGDRYASYSGSEIRYDQEQGSYAVDENGDSVTDFEIDNPDFNIRDFNSNLVIRWEYDPGSTLFLVWSQARGDFLNTGDFNLRNDMDGLFGVHPHNVLLLKFNKWFSL